MARTSRHPGHRALFQEVRNLKAFIADHVEFTEAEMSIMIAAVGFYINEGFGGKEVDDLLSKLELCLTEEEVEVAC